MTMGCSHGTFLRAGLQFRLPLKSSIHSLFLVTTWDQEVESLILSSGGYCPAGKMTETDVSTTGGPSRRAVLSGLSCPSNQEGVHFSRLSLQHLP